ncbi:hypothetical protein MJD09_04305 [bacterium]|nr:hypothetical protein [bacterium]
MIDKSRTDLGQRERAAAWRVERAGVIPYRLSGTALSVLLISSKRRKSWMLPKRCDRQRSIAA